MYDANIRKRKGTRTFLTSKKRRHLDRLNESDDLSQNLDTDNGKSNLDLCQLCKGLHILFFNPAPAEIKLSHLQTNYLVMITHCNFPRKFHHLLFLLYHVHLHLNQLIMLMEIVIQLKKQNKKIC